MKKHLPKISVILLCICVASTFFACKKAEQKPVEYERCLYEGKYSDVNGSLVGTDDLGRALSLEYSLRDVSPETDGVKKEVGVFYFLWLGQHGTKGPYDNSAIVRSNPKAILTEAGWLKSGGGDKNAMHFWGKPLFGYYVMTDEWVISKHLQMLTDAGVDYVVFDVTNGYIYENVMKVLLKVWYKNYQDGVDVPKLAFYTNTDSGKTVTSVYKHYYNSKTMKTRYPDLDKLWYMRDGKPLIIGKQEEVSDEIGDYFYFKTPQWPTKEKKANGFPWMEFSRLLSDDAVYGKDGRKEIMSVSAAQHCATGAFSNTAWYGGKDRTRSWHDGSNDTSENAVNYGYNFAEQWNFAISKNPENIFVTGWNEWGAQRQARNYDNIINFVDCADANCSRDIEPSAESFGDNYYMQLCDFIRKFKNTPDRVNIGKNVTIDINGSFSQWNNEKITAVYSDYKNDGEARDCKGFGSLRYKTPAAENDFITMKTARDDDSIFFYASFAGDIKNISNDLPLSLFINVDATGIKDSDNSWYGYDYCVNLTDISGTETDLLASSSKDFSWTTSGKVQYRIEGNQVMLSVRRSDLASVAPDWIDISFKWANGYTKNENGKYDIFSFYTGGDAAPYGRLNFLFSEVAEKEK